MTENTQHCGDLSKMERKAQTENTSGMNNKQNVIVADMNSKNEIIFADGFMMDSERLIFLQKYFKLIIIILKFN